MQTVTLDQNNSGGYFWLSDEQFDALLADGWYVAEDSGQWRLNSYGKRAQNLKLDVPVEREDHAVTIAKIEFERITGEQADAIGCTCCGPPFDFNTY